MKVTALQSFHYNGAAGVAHAGIGEEFDLPDHLVDSYVSLGRVRVLPAEQAPPALPVAPAPRPRSSPRRAAPEVQPQPEPTPVEPSAVTTPASDPLDHDGNGKKGGSKPTKGPPRKGSKKQKG